MLEFFTGAFQWSAAGHLFINLLILLLPSAFIIGFASMTLILFIRRSWQT